MKEGLFIFFDKIFSIDVNWWIIKFEYKNDDTGYWKKIKGCRGEYNIPDHNVWINN
jgi:hypothetical protein